MTPELGKVFEALLTLGVAAVTSYLASYRAAMRALARVQTDIEWMKKDRDERKEEVDKRFDRAEDRIGRLETSPYRHGR